MPRPCKFAVTIEINTLAWAHAPVICLIAVSVSHAVENGHSFGESFSVIVCNLCARLAADFLKVDYLFLAVGVVGGACSDVEQHIIQVTQYSKREQLLDLLKATGDPDLTFS